MVYRNDVEGIANYLSDTMMKFTVEDVEKVYAVRKRAGSEYNTQIRSLEIMDGHGVGYCIVPDVDCILFGEDVISVVVYIPTFWYKVRVLDDADRNGPISFNYKVDGFRIKYAIKYDGSQTYETEIFELEFKIRNYLYEKIVEFNGDWIIELEKSPNIVFGIEEGKRR